MNEQERSNSPQDDSLDKIPPAPVEPARGTGPGSIVLGAVLFLIGAMAMLVLIAPLFRPVEPATRSERLETERRLLEIEQAERELAVHDQVDANR